MNPASYFKVEYEPQAIVVTILRDLGAVAEDEMRGEWKKLITRCEQEPPRNVIVDFGNIDYFGSVMLELLVSLGRTLKPWNGHLILCNLSETGVEILNIARFNTLYPITTSRQTAMALLPPN